MSTTVRSFSKINLGLAIGPARPDGFHGLATCYQTLAAHDLVTVEAIPAAATHLQLTSNDARVPTDGRNTAWKMVEQALTAMGATAEVRVHIEKRLPVQGGIGAGSANAVAALVGLERELAGAGIAALSNEERLRIAADVGSDVPLFLVGGAALGTGRGETVTPLPDFLAMECVLALPEVAVSTPQAFRAWDAGAVGALTGPEASGRLETLSRVLASAFAPGLPEELPAGRGSHSSGVFAVSEDLAGKTGLTEPHPLLALVRTGIENDFEQVVFRQHPFLGTIKRLLADSVHPGEAAVYAALSGSGSAVFGLYGTAEAAEAAERRLGEAGVRALRTRTLPREDYWRTMVE
ncbi:MAG TPA: 4-(cytidine 5'-diphospho)-2-C-methyl-D-erythritol kinase [Acidobacteriaceae bacterium]|jgi:4-diphosphocytidyl-2-C-methyl-D-erythritol kinase|nr:4-(cytidine 5'-diphospho)-2-C-methyl-D-erythritol kinase [Acidobacteriaceae bacterium]